MQSKALRISGEVAMLFFVVLILFFVAYLYYNFFVKKKNIEELNNLKSMSWLDFEFFCIKILKQNGYEVISHYGKDQKCGIDILAQKDKKIYAIQCKKYSSLVNCDGIYEVLRGKEYFNADIAVVLTNSFFKKETKYCAREKKVQLWDGNNILWLMKHSQNIKEEDKKKYFQRSDKHMYGEKGNLYPEGQYITGEDFPLGKYLFKPTSEYSGHIDFFSSYEKYISGENGKTEYFDNSYFVNFKVEGNYIVVHGAKFEQIS